MVGVKTAQRSGHVWCCPNGFLGVWLKMSTGTGGGELDARLDRGTWRNQAATRGVRRRRKASVVLAAAHPQPSLIARVDEASLFAIDC